MPVCQRKKDDARCTTPGTHTQVFKAYLLGVVHRHVHALMPHFRRWLQDADQDVLLQEQVGAQMTGFSGFFSKVLGREVLGSESWKRCRGHMLVLEYAQSTLPPCVGWSVFFCFTICWIL